MVTFSCRPVSFSLQLGRLSNVVITSSLPVSVFHLTKTLYNKTDIAWIAAIFVSFSQLLTTLGTHTLVNSFISPFLFYALTEVLSFIIRCKQDKSEINTSINKYTTENQNGHISNYLQNGGHTTKLQNGVDSFANGSIKHVDYKNNQNGSNGISNGLLSEQSNTTSKESRKSNFTLLANLAGSGFVLGVVCYIRTDATLLIAILVFVFTIECIYEKFANIWKLLGHCPVLVFGFGSGACLGGLADRVMYGVWFLSPLQWYRININTDIPSILFGSSSLDVYVTGIFLQNAYTAVFYLVAAIAVCSLMTSYPAATSQEQRRHTVTLALACMVLFSVYLTVNHKEVRFLHNFIVLMLVMSAFSLHFLISSCLPLSRRTSKFVMYALLVSYVINAYMTFPSIHFNSQELRTKKMKESAEVNGCLEFISRQSDVSGVFVDASLYQMAGFSIIKHDVPIVILLHNEYHEYSNVMSASLNETGIRVINRFSDFIHSSNIIYLTKHLLTELSYNYIVTSRIREFSFGNIGFNTVFSFGAHMVLRRTLDNRQRELAKTYATSLKDGDNATVLEYEASWLFTAGLYLKSILRAESAIQVNDARIRPYQIMGLSQVRLDNWVDARKTEQRCFQRHGEAKCRTPQPRVVIHKEYMAFDKANPQY